MPIFFANKNDINEDEKTVKLDSETSKHISKVLRYKEGDFLTISNGDNESYNCTISSIDDENVYATIISKFESKNEMGIEVNLYQGIAKGEKMDTIIQKATELGISNIIPVETKFTVVKLSDDTKANKKIERWNKIAYEAAKQSERGIIPEVKMPIKFKNALIEATRDGGIAMICYGREDHYNLKAFFKDRGINKDNLDKITRFSFFIGPEGGFDISEIEMAKENGIEAVSLGDRILRTETASLAVLSMLQYELF